MAKLQNIDCPQAFVRFLEKYRLHNASCETLTHIRKKQMEDGSIKEILISRKTGVLPEQIKTTFYMMLQKYAENYNYIAANIPADFRESGQLPAFLTNNVRLAEYCDCSDKTIYNHRTQLKSLGVISSKFRGRKSDFEMWISAEILFGSETEATPENRSEAPKTALPPVVMKTFTVNNINRENIEKEKNNMDMLISRYRENSYRERGRTDSSDPTLKAPTTHATERTNSGGGVRPTPAENAAAHTEKLNKAADAFSKLKNPALPPRLEKYFAKMLMSFWSYAWKMLYETRDFSTEQQEKAMYAIYEGVFNKFEDERTAKEWASFQALQLEKIDKAAKFYTNNPDAYKPDPYAVYIAGKGYFDQANNNGFQAIDGWIKKDQIKAACRKNQYEQEKYDRETKAARLLARARRDFERQAAGAEMRKEVMHKSQL